MYTYNIIKKNFVNQFDRTVSCFRRLFTFVVVQCLLYHKITSMFIFYHKITIIVYLWENNKTYEKADTAVKVFGIISQNKLKNYFLNCFRLVFNRYSLVDEYHSRLYAIT